MATNREKVPGETTSDVGSMRMGGSPNGGDHQHQQRQPAQQPYPQQSMYARPRKERVDENGIRYPTQHRNRLSMKPLPQLSTALGQGFGFHPFGRGNNAATAAAGGAGGHGHGASGGGGAGVVGEAGESSTGGIGYDLDMNSPMVPRMQQASQSFVDTMSQQLSIHVEQPVGSMSISPSSRDVVLAGRRGLYIIDLENPYEPPRVLHHLTKWEVADVQWNPHYARENWIASTSNQKGLIWNLAPSAPRPVELILHAHSRAISDINWSPFYPDLLATCSVDTFVHLWDLRTPKKPVNSFCAWTAAATVVKFNRKDEHILASAHDTKVEVWDMRKGSSPFTSIVAHQQKINGIDWSRKHKDHIVSCSLDKMVKFWDISQPEQPHKQIVTKSPVWRARHTPFGHGILTMPQRTETTLYLWNRDRSAEPVCKFEGHTDTVKEFVWRVRGGAGGSDPDQRQFQLVTWSKDQHLRLWPISDKVLEDMDYKSTSPIDMVPNPASYDSTLSFRDPAPVACATTPSRALRVLAGNRMSAMTPFRTAMSSRTIDTFGSNGGFFRERKAPSPLVWMQGVRMVKSSGDLGGAADRGASSPQTVATEIAAVGQKFQNVKFEKVNVTGRTCTISLNSLRHSEGASFLRVNITFPPLYPKEAPPTFEIQKSGMLSMATRAQIVANLDQIATTHAARGLPCLEAIIRSLLGEDQRETIDQGLDDSDEDDTIVNPLRKARNGRDNGAVNKKDQQVPFPCLCGAVFATNGKLVAFFSKLRTPHSSSSRPMISTGGAGGRSLGGSIVKSTVTYVHPRSYDYMPQYKALSRLPTGTDSLAGTVSRFVADNEEMDDLWPMNNMYSKPKTNQELVRVSRKNPSEHHKSAYNFNKSLQSRSTLHFKDVTYLLPVSPRLAAAYTLNGDNVEEICEHNALQARHVGRMDLFKIWKLASLILTLSVPMDPVAFQAARAEIGKMNSRTHPDKILDLLMRSDNAKQRRDSGTAFIPMIEDTFFQKVRWGTHPLGRTLVDVLFSYLEQHGDIQMLALLSCVFKEPFRNTIPVSGVGPPQAHARTYESPASDMPDYFSRQPTGTRSLHTLSIDGTPLSIDPGVLRPRTPMTAATTRISPYLHRMSPTTSQVGSSLRRTASRVYYQGGGGPLTSPLMTPSSFSEASGPPFFLAGHQHYMSNSSASMQMTHQKRESLASMPGTSPVLLSKLQQQSLQRQESMTPSSLFDRGDHVTIRSEGIVVVKMNTNFFDSEESPMNIPLLDPAKETQYNIWRLLYAEMMFSWGLFEARAELLKFLTIPRLAPHRLLSSNSVSFQQQQQQQQQQQAQRGGNISAGGMASSASSATSMSLAGAAAVAMATKDEQPTALEQILGIERRGLQIGNKCFECETRLLPNYRCDFCRKVRPGIKCAICHLSVRGRTSACLKCGHGGHMEHYREWFVQERNGVCPTGCGCECMLDFGGWTGGLPVRPPIHPQQVASSVS